MSLFLLYPLHKTENSEYNRSIKGDDIMLKNCPAAYLFLMSLGALMVFLFISPIIGVWSIYFETALHILTFTTKVICLFFLFIAVVDLLNSIHLRKHIH